MLKLPVNTLRVVLLLLCDSFQEAYGAGTVRGDRKMDIFNTSDSGTEELDISYKKEEDCLNCSPHHHAMHLDWDSIGIQSLPSHTGEAVVCSEFGTAAVIGGVSYPCMNMELQSFMNLSTLNKAGIDGSAEANDCWGWTDEASNREFGLVGVRRGTAFVEITDPVNPVYLGILPSHLDGASSWRDIKTYKNTAYIVSEHRTHGMQVFDLTQLLSASTKTPTKFVETNHYDKFGSAHNIAINEESGYAYAVGTGNCNGGLEMVNIQDQLKPVEAGCFSSDGYTHDVQCVNYKGPDSAYNGKEICFAANEDTVTIVDVTDKEKPVQLSRNTYDGDQYTHQGWLTEDHKYFVFGDELDEYKKQVGTTSYVFKVTSLKSPKLMGSFKSSNNAIDHNQYIVGDYIYQANYRAGLRVLKINDLETMDVEEFANFDIFPSSDSNNFNGAWSNYPFFKSGSILVSGIEQGLYVLKLNTPQNTTIP